MFFEPQFSHFLLIVPFVTLSLGYGLSYRKPNLALSRGLLLFRIMECLCALSLCVLVFSRQAFEYNFFQVTFFSHLSMAFGLRADALSVLVLSMITLLSLCIFRFSIHYLEGDERQSFFYRHYQKTIFFVILLVMANNLAFFFMAWLGISTSLHKLLLYFEDRPKAKRAAHKKWIVSRMGDVALLGAILLTWHFFKTLNFSDLIVLSHQANQINPILDKHSFALVGVLIVIGALAKSAQFPFHVWLPETMETPTPVSALMHAGIINGGGYLVIRLSPVLIHATLAHTILIVIGGISAVLGALTMMTQTNIKKQLAYSTISQLGFMMIQCGIGAYTLALFHMIAHGFYKAHAFLATPTALDEPKAPKRNLSRSGLLFSFTLSGACLSFAFLHEGLLGQSSHVIYFGLLALALTQVIGSRKLIGLAFHHNPFPSTLFFLSSFSLYFAFEFLMIKKFNTIIPNHFDSKFLSFSAVIFLYFLFAVGIYLAKKMQDLSNPLSQKIGLFFWNECYLSSLSSKVFPS
jgi:NADH:ubiquinone oxidoreductase subunit 5 (subunit L)/multisubunit Na+/H+ antiporter MnhA subunit